MSLAVLYSRALSVMDAPDVVVEVHLVNWLPSFIVVGLSEKKSSDFETYPMLSLAFYCYTLC